MKPGNLRQTQGAKSGGSVSKDEGASTINAPPSGGAFSALPNTSPVFPCFRPGGAGITEKPGT